MSREFVECMGRKPCAAWPCGITSRGSRRKASEPTLEQVYGAITFYLGHKSEVENDIAEREREEDEYSTAHPPTPDLKEKFERMRQQLQARRS
jgi:hypothetical protein